MSDEWTTLQERLATAFASFLDACDHVDPGLYEQGTVDGQWPLKAIVAHLTGWDHEATERFWLFRAGPTENVDYNEDEFNARSVAARQHLSYNQAIKELRSVHHGLEDAIAALQPEDLEGDNRFAAWLNTLSGHYEEHTAQLQGLIVHENTR